MYTTYALDRAIHLISFLGFVFGMSISLLAYVASSYFKEVVASDNVSFFYIVIFCVLLILLFKLNRIIEGFGRARTLMALLATQIAVLFVLQFTDISWEGALLMIAYYVLYGIIGIVFDIVLEAYSTNGYTGRLRGMYLSVWNFGILIGPLISMFLLERYGFSLIFTVTLILYVMMFLTVFVALNDITGHVVPQHLRTKHTFIKFIQRSALVRIYWVSFTLHYFYAVMTIYMPLYLRDIGLSWGEIGWIFTIMLTPFILFQYPAGVIADKLWGEKELLFIGSVIMILSAGAMYMAHTTTFVFWATILFISRVGAALVEALQDSYFYKQIDENDIALINFFRSTRAVSYIVAALTVGVTLAIIDDMRMIFVAVIIVMIVGFIPIITLKDSQPVKG